MSRIEKKLTKTEKSFPGFDYFEEAYEKWHPPLKTRFEDEVEKYWGRAWGANTMIGRLRVVMLHRPGNEIKSIKTPLGVWRYTEKPNLDEMIEDHEKLVKAYRGESVEVVIRKPETYNPPRLVKSIYTMDPSFECKGGMIIGRMYDALRRGEEVFTFQTYAEIGCPVVGMVHGTGTAEGGGVCWLDNKHLALTTGFRFNEEGARQVTEIVKISDPEVEVVAVPLYHGHGPVSMVDKHTAVLLPFFQLPYTFIDYMRNKLGMRLIDLRRIGNWSVGIVAIKPGKVLIQQNEECRKLLEKEGLDVIQVDLPSLVIPRNSGTLSCLSRPLMRDPEPKN